MRCFCNRIGLMLIDLVVTRELELALAKEDDTTHDTTNAWPFLRVASSAHLQFWQHRNGVATFRRRTFRLWSHNKAPCVSTMVFT